MPASPSQLRGLMVLLAILITILTYRLALNSKPIPEFKPDEPPTSDHLSDHIDPNTATESELAAIPDLGEKRAHSIVQFREQYQSLHPNHLAFAHLSDLEKISGIGPATAETMAPYLIFPQPNTIQHSPIPPSTR